MILSSFFFFTITMVYGQPFCAPSCVRCVNQSVCLECEAGFWSKHCMRFCADSCGGDGACDRENGWCLACKQGWFGPLCESRCPRGCRAPEPNPLGLGDGPCSTNASASASASGDGAAVNCLLGCADGRFNYRNRADCSGLCPTTCARSAASNQTVDGPCDLNLTAGDVVECRLGCVSGFAGPSCSKSSFECPNPNCGAVDESQAACDSNGICTAGCRPGLWGASTCDRP
jgi:hypothetical protein